MHLLSDCLQKGKRKFILYWLTILTAILKFFSGLQHNVAFKVDTIIKTVYWQ